MTKPLSKEEIISDVVTRNHRMAELLSDYGLACINCPVNRFETVEEGAQLHGMSDTEIKAMIDEINTQIKSEKS